MIDLPAGVTVLERGWLSSNNVLVIGSDSTALVDSGYSTHSAQTVSLVRSALGGRVLGTLVNTHLHSDHVGGNAALQAAYPAVRTLIPPGQAALVRDWDLVGLTYVPTGQQCERFHSAGVLIPGSPVRLGDAEWEVHAAPGHDPNSVILFEPRSRTLLSADALWENGFGIVFPELEGQHAFEEVAQTLDLIESLNPAVVVPGHGHVFVDLPGALGRARSRLAAYVAQPDRHAAHAAKVLLKFKLLELQRVRSRDLVSWAETTPYFRLVQQRWAPDMSLADWVLLLLDQLEKSGAARRDGELLFNE